MELLVTVADVRSRLVLPVHTDVDNAITSAITAAQLDVEAQLGLTFAAQQGGSDLFHVDVESLWTTLPHDVAPLRLHTGFVNRASLVLTRFDFLEDALDSEYAGGEVINPRYYMMSERDAIMGVVRVNTAYYDKTFVRVQYDSGMEDEAPDWLRQAIIERTTTMISTVAPSKDTPQAVSLGKNNKDNTLMLLRPFNRRAVAFAFDPVN